MSRDTFSVAYDGPALRDGAMDVRDLAPALLALGQLLDAANSNLNGDSAQIKLQVRATKPGSFQIVFDVVQNWTTQVLHLFAGPEISGATNLLTWVLGGTTGATSLFWLVKKLRGRSPDSVEKIAPDVMRLTIDGEGFDVPFQLLRLYQDVAVRTAVQKVVEVPLGKDGIDVFEIRRDDVVIERVEKPEAGYFARPVLADEILIDELRRSAFSIVSLAFKEDNKWRLFDGNTQISATITDDDFLSQIESNVAFSKGDILICDVRVTQRRTIDGLRTDYVVEKVVEHRLAARQLPLPMISHPDRSA